MQGCEQLTGELQELKAGWMTKKSYSSKVRPLVRNHNLDFTCRRLMSRVQGMRFRFGRRVSSDAYRLPSGRSMWYFCYWK